MEFIEIKGNHYNTGFILGKCQMEIFNEYMNTVKGKLKNENFSESFKLYEKLLKKFPEWIEEIHGYCDGARINFEDIIIYNTFDIFSSCTSLFLSKSYTDKNLNVVMKIRDEKPYPQYAGKKKNFNKTPYFFSGSVGHIGISFFMKETGYTGINNTGSFLKKEEINESGFNDCEIMKILAEYTENPSEGIEMIKKLQKDKLIGKVGKGRGAIFLLADRKESFLIEITSYNLNFKRIEDKIGFTNDFLIEESFKWIEEIHTEGTKSSKIRKERIDELLKRENIDRKYLCRISRDKENYPYSISRDTKLMSVRTIAAFIAYLDENPFLWVCLGHPYVSPYFSFYVKGEKILDEIVSGKVSKLLNLKFEEKKMEDEGYLKEIENFEDEIEKEFFMKKNFEEINIEIQKKFFYFISQMKR